MAAKKSQELSERISGNVSDELLKKTQELWMHEDFRKRVLDLVVEHEGTRAFEESVSTVIERYLKIRTGERVFWVIGLVIAAVVGYFLKKITG